MDPAPLKSGHWLQLEHLAGLHDSIGGPVGEVAQLPFAPTAVVLDVHQDACPLPDTL